MRRKFKQALSGLKHTYPSPDPIRQEEFLKRLPAHAEQPKTNVPLLHIGGKPLWYAFPAVVTAALMLTVGISVYQNHQPHSIPNLPEETTTATVTETTAPSSTQPAMPDDPAQTGTPATDAVRTTGQGTVATFPAVSGTQPQWTATGGQLIVPPVQTVPQTTAVSGAASGTDTIPTGSGSTPSAPVSDDTSTSSVDRLPSVTETTSTEDNEYPICPSETTTQKPDVTHPVQTTLDADDDPSNVVEDPEPPAQDSLQYQPVTPAYQYTISESLLEWMDFFETGMSDDVNWSDGTWWQSLAYASQTIVSGQIVGVWYTQVNGVPYTQIDVWVEHSYRGQCSDGVLSVYEKGGYVPLNVLTEHFGWASRRTFGMSTLEILKTTVHETGSLQKAPEIGDDCLLFLKDAETSGIPYGAFEYAGFADYSRLCLLGTGTSDMYSAADGRTVLQGALADYVE